jgi:hypothetical protein
VITVLRKMQMVVMSVDADLVLLPHLPEAVNL